MTVNVSTNRVERTEEVEACLFWLVIVYHNSYKKWFMAGDAQRWGEMMDEKKIKKYKIAL